MTKCVLLQQVENSNSDAVEDKVWFFGPLRRSEAERLLTERAKNGEFLVRNCETSVSLLGIVQYHKNVQYRFLQLRELFFG